MCAIPAWFKLGYIQLSHCCFSSPLCQSCFLKLPLTRSSSPPQPNSAWRTVPVGWCHRVDTAAMKRRRRGGRKNDGKRTNLALSKSGSKPSSVLVIPMGLSGIMLLPPAGWMNIITTKTRVTCTLSTLEHLQVPTADLQTEFSQMMP